MGKQAKSQTFESALAELENIVASMESGQLPLEQLLTAYKRGAGLLQFCQQTLQDAQQQVRILEAGSLLNFPTDADTQGGTSKSSADND
ncbi:MAG: exodeoxyribonuclease VII small subunit [Betaproteobacteria bacterium]